MPYVSVDLIEVWAWGKLVGALAASSRHGTYAFEYDPSWIRRNVQLAPELMPLRPSVFVFEALPHETYQGLPPMIADSLPDRFGNSIVDAWLARNGIAKSDVSALDRLAYLGDRGMGALTYRPDHQPDLPPPTALDMGELVSSARRAVEGSLASEDESQGALQRIIDVGTSAGGARAKAIINYNVETGDVRSGHSTSTAEYQPWIIKFDGIGADDLLSRGQSFGRIEYAYSLMARAAGITMSETRLLEEHGRAHFMTRRFDRTGQGGRVHMQTLCALAGVDFNAVGVNDYAQYFSAIRSLDLPSDAMEQAFRRMAFNVAAANHDDHTKNFAFLMDESGTWSLAPAYDVTHAYASNSVWISQHLMSVNGKFTDINRKDIVAVAERFGIRNVSIILREVDDALSSWGEFAEAAALERAAADSVAEHFRQVGR